MKFAEAKQLIRDSAGYRVEFEKIESGVLVSDHFPDNDEPTIPSANEAWQLATLFAHAGKKKGIVNVYVIHGDDYTPVAGYKEKELNIYPPPLEEVAENFLKEYWHCIIGPINPTIHLPSGSDLPLRSAVAAAFKKLTGIDAETCTSSWGVSEEMKDRMLQAKYSSQNIKTEGET
jgi:hypothetical protein